MSWSLIVILTSFMKTLRIYDDVQFVHREDKERMSEHRGLFITYPLHEGHRLFLCTPLEILSYIIFCWSLPVCKHRHVSPQHRRTLVSQLQLSKEQGRIHGIRCIPACTDGQKRHFCMISTRVWRTDGRTNGRTNRPTDIPSYIDARTHLKSQS